MKLALVITACMSAFVAGLLALRVATSYINRIQRHRELQGNLSSVNQGNPGSNLGVVGGSIPRSYNGVGGARGAGTHGAYRNGAAYSVGGFDATLLSWMAAISAQITMRQTRKAKMACWNIGLSASEDILHKAGLSDVITKDGIAKLRQTLSLGFAGVGAVIGVCFSELLAVLLLVVGFTGGFVMPKRALLHEQQQRAYDAEQQLSQMIEVIILGLRSGLSFDKSLSLYTQHFTGTLSTTCALAQKQWEHALKSRNDALRFIAQSYDSSILERVIESIIRSLRFGTSLTDVLSHEANEARAIRKSKLEERISKAPVKMMIPVGTLILPAMLILVLGPILLDLMAGW